MSGYTIVNLQSDSAAWAKSVKDALTGTKPDDVKQAWIDVGINSAKITAGMAELAVNDPGWTKWVGDRATIVSIGVSAERIRASLQSPDGFNSVKASDALAVVGGISDLLGNVAVKPGPWLAAGLIAKTVGAGAGIAQNIVGDQTVAQLLGTGTVVPPVLRNSAFVGLSDSSLTYAPDGTTPLSQPQITNSGNTRIETLWNRLPDGGYQKVETVTTLDTNQQALSSSVGIYRYNSDGAAVQGLTVTRDAHGNATQTNTLLPSSDGQSWVAPSVGSISISSQSQEIAALTQASGAQRVEKLADGSTTYHYGSGVSINSNAVTGEYHMVLANTDGGGGQTVYSRTPDLDAGYVVKQVQTNAAGAVVYDYLGFQESLSGDIRPISSSWETPTEAGHTSWGVDGSYTTHTTNTATQVETVKSFTGAGVLNGVSQTCAAITFDKGRYISSKTKRAMSANGQASSANCSTWGKAA